MQGEALLQFHPFSSAVDVSFWYELAKRKLHVFQLDERPVDIQGSYVTGVESKVGSLLSVNHDSFDRAVACVCIPHLQQAYTRSPQRAFVSPGQLFNSNTIEAFKNLPRPALFENAAKQIAADIASGAALSDPTLLTRFILTCHADLKKYIFYYMFAFPALAFPGEAQPSAQPAIALDHASSPFVGAAAEQLLSKYESAGRSAFFVAKNTASGVEVAPLASLTKLYNADEISKGDFIVGFADPCILPAHPGWPLRNLLFLLARQFNVRRVTVVSMRGSKDKSLVFRVSLPELGSDKDGTAVGWEKNGEGKLVPRVANLSSAMDPAKLAARSAELNLQLMKWRLLPNLQLERLAAAKCLLIGAGTLGCNLARNLLAWGVRHITFVDNGKVSYSNPVRQSLFTFEDSVNGGKAKAACAAERLAQILPSVAAKGHSITVPMPGHSIAAADTERVGQDIKQLLELVRTHDAVFLGTDSRESRWLPTLLAAAEGKLLINAALGFDTYLVMRHGLGTGAQRLGCYFCNDVVAPGDSQKDRTLDQQCTVTRPGVSAMAAALAVELFVAVTHHKDGGHAPADVTDEAESGLGFLPHQVRGFLCTFKELLVSVEAYDRCTACSKVVLEQYQKRGLEFLFEAFQNPKYLEDLTGLTKLKTEPQSSVSFEVQEGDDF